MLRRLYVHNFRCLENFELPLAGRATNLLIGKNGSGKSTVREALEVLQKMGRKVSAVERLVTPLDLSRGRSDTPMRFEVEAEIGGGVYTYSVAFELPPGFRELRVREEKLALNGKAVFSRELASVTQHRTAKRTESTFGIDWHVAGLPVIYADNNDPLVVFRDWLAQSIIIRPVPSLISGESKGQTLLPETDVSNLAEWFTGLISLAPAAYSKIDQYLRGSVFPDLVEIKNPTSGPDTRSLAVEFLSDSAATSIPFAYLSDGEKCFIVCSLALAANATYGPLLCFWDEPDCHLAPHEIGHLILALRRAFEARGQLIVTSHNPETIARFSNENTVLLHRRSHCEPTSAYTADTLDIQPNLIDALIRGDVEP